MSEYLPVSFMPNTFFVLFRLYFLHPYVAISYYNYVSIYLFVTSIHKCLPYVSVCLSVSLSLNLPLFLRHYVGIACVQMCSSVCHTHVSTLTVRINLLNCVVTHVSLIARPPGCLFVVYILAHLSVLLSSITFSTYYHHFLS